MVMPASRKIKYNNPACIFPTHGEFSSDPPSCISHLFHFFLTSVHVLFITVGNDGIVLQVLRLCSEHLISGYITIIATQPSIQRHCKLVNRRSEQINSCCFGTISRTLNMLDALLLSNPFWLFAFTNLNFLVERIPVSRKEKKKPSNDIHYG